MLCLALSRESASHSLYYFFIWWKWMKLCVCFLLFTQFTYNNYYKETSLSNGCYKSVFNSYIWLLCAYIFLLKLKQQRFKILCVCVCVFLRALQHHLGCCFIRGGLANFVILSWLCALKVRCLCWAAVWSLQLPDVPRSTTATLAPGPLITPAADASRRRLGNLGCNSLFLWAV